MGAKRTATGERGEVAYVWRSAVGARCYLRLVEVDEDAGVAEGTAAAVAGDDPVM